MRITPVDVAAWLWLGRGARAVAVVALLCGDAQTAHAQSPRTTGTARTPPPPAVADVLHTAREIVRQGGAAGLVLRLDGPGRPASGGPLFDLDTAADGVKPLADLRGTPADMLRRHVGRDARFALTGNVIVDATARSCRALLTRSAVVDARGTVFQAAVAAFNAATRKNIPVGAVGTCAIGVARGDDAVRLKGRMSLRAALQSAVGQVAGVVWLAVEGVDGRCGVGLLSRDEFRMKHPQPGDDTFCTIQIATVP
jgi:hypothetical protein